MRDYIHVSDLSAAHVAAARLVEISHQAELLRAAGDRVQDAAPRAESAAARLPGGFGRRGGGRTGAGPGHRTDACCRPRRRARRPAHPRRDPRNVGPGGRRGQAGDLVAEVATQLGSMVARVAGVEDAPRLDHHVAVNIGTGRGYSVFEVIEALRRSMGRGVRRRHRGAPARGSPSSDRRSRPRARAAGVACATHPGRDDRLGVGRLAGPPASRPPLGPGGARRRDGRATAWAPRRAPGSGRSPRCHPAGSRRHPGRRLHRRHWASGSARGALARLRVTKEPFLAISPPSGVCSTTVPGWNWSVSISGP